MFPAMTLSNDMRQAIGLARKSALFFACLAGALFVFGFIDAWEPGLGFLLFILGVPLLAIALLSGTIACVVFAWRNRGDFETWNYRAVALATAPILTIVTVSLALPTLWVGSYTGDMSRLLIEHDEYEAIIAEVRANPEQAWFEESRGVTYSVDLGPPIRLAFNPAGLLDNWSGIIYDPTGEMMLADGFDPETGRFRAPDRITKLFGGDLVGCRHLWSDYYTCSFT